MRIFLCLLWACLPPTLYSQDTNSLLWEISGNGLEQSSYLYGTMHVSKKIAFLLDDVFYDALDQAEVIALESDPATWLENDTGNGSNYSQSHVLNAKGFYSEAFALPSPDKKALASFLASDDALVNNILYRTNEYAQNFEEDTYLDMFIYQAGSKFGKPVLALEDLEESQALVGKASLNAMKQTPDEWLQEKMQRNDLMSLLQDAYRERNINLLDSIDRAMYTDHYLTNMLYLRNGNMARRLDSAIRKTRVFAGIGAAHLPGEKGVIALLEQQGYTVRPLVSEATIQGTRLKEKFEKSFREQPTARQQPEDAFFSISLPHKLYPVAEAHHTTYISPDLTNGSYLMVHRIPTFSLLNRKAAFTVEDLEGLLFENIPGRILEKNRISRQGYDGLDIKNQLKNGDHQRYQLFLTPLEVLVFKMAGEGSYVPRYSDPIFNSLQFRPHREASVRLSSAFADFEVELPGYYSFANQKRLGKRRVEAFDRESGAYYFLQQATLNDVEFIEQDHFELRQIQKRFYQRLGLQASFEKPEGQALGSSAAVDSTTGTRLYLHAEIRRSDYFLLGILSRDPEEAARYFNSFQLRDPEYHAPFEHIRDTALLFTTRSPVPPQHFVESSLGHFKGRTSLKPYDPYIKKSRYQYENNEAITVSLSKSHDYMTFPHIDSVWALRKKQYTGNSLFITEEQAATPAPGIHELRLTLGDTASSRRILIKNVLRGGLLYELRAPLDSVHGASRFISEFFAHFQPMDTLIGRDLMEDKTTNFFAALRANDSIVMKGYRYLLFDERHADSLMHYIATFNFSGGKEHIQSYLLQELGNIHTPEVAGFLRDYYASSYTNSNAQTKILQAVSTRADAVSARNLLTLLSRDLPLVANPYEIDRIFAPFRANLPMARALFPELLEYSTITEYKEPIISLLTSLVSQGYLPPGRYKKFVADLLIDANRQLKRQLGVEVQSRAQKSQYQKTGKAQKRLLEDYTQLLYPFRKEKEIQLFFRRLSQVKDPEVRTTYAALLAREGSSMPIGFMESLLADINSRALLLRKLQESGNASLLLQERLDQRDLAEAALYEDQHFDPTLDTVQFIAQQPLSYNDREYLGYFFKSRSELDYNKNFKMYLVVYPADAPLSIRPYYKNQGMRIGDTDTEAAIKAHLTEEFRLKEHPRAIVPEPGQLSAYGYGI